MTNWIEWHGGECPIVSGDTIVERKSRNGLVFVGLGLYFQWHHGVSRCPCGDIIAYRIIDDHEPKMTREQITAQIDALQKQLDAMPVVSWIYWANDGYLRTHRELVDVINGVLHIHGVAMKKVGK